MRICFRIFKVIFFSILISIFFIYSSVLTHAESTFTGRSITGIKYKIVDYDEILISWDKQESMYYYLYKTEIKTGKTVKSKLIKNNTIKVSGLSAETKYTFSISAINSNTLDEISRSKEIIILTPSKWHYYGDYVIDYDKELFESYFYKTNYNNTITEQISIGDIKSVDEIIFYNGWYYIIGDYDSIVNDDKNPFVWKMGSKRKKCVARIHKKTQKKEILFCDFAQSEGFIYNYKITSDYIYIYRESRSQYKEKYINDLYYYPYEYSDFYKISLSTGVVKKVCDVYSSALNSFDVSNNYIYYIYDKLLYDNNHNLYYNYVYKFLNNRYKKIDRKKQYYVCRITTEGTNRTKVQNISLEDIDYNEYMYIYNDFIFFYSKSKKNNYIYKMSLCNGKIESVCKLNLYIEDFNISNGYIYCNLYEEDFDKSNCKYCRITIDGSKKEIQDNPFEWHNVY